jgi:enamine deaminase RidA (YjgF/YER057c/UK114 family)
MTDIVKLTLYVTDKVAYQANLRPIGEAYRSFFGRYYPAMTLVEVKSLFDDDALVEIEGIAVLGEQP